MKRWQDRGEVQDSEEEVLDITSESQSPEQPRKRLKVEATQVQNVQSGCQEQKANARNSPRHVYIGRQLQNRRTESVGAEEDVHNELWLQTQQVTLREERLRSTKSTLQPVTSQLQISLGSHTSSSGRSSPVNIEMHLHHHTTDKELSQTGSVMGAESKSLRLALNSKLDEELPKLSRTPPDRAGHNRLVLGNISGRSSGSDSSALSSPLSTPEMLTILPNLAPEIRPATFQDPRGISDGTVDGQGSTNHAPTTNSKATNLAEMDPAVPLQIETSTIAGGRALRVRTEKQLHPYVYDRTLYQQQLRQRGLRPVKFVVKSQDERETQDQSYNTTSESEDQNSSSEARQGSGLSDEVLLTPSRLRLHNNESISNIDEFDFPDVDALLDWRYKNGTQNGYKRRKTFHTKISGKLKSVRVRNHTHQSATDSNEDQSSVPLSPPPTSNISARDEERRPLPSGFVLPPGFKMPLARTPGPLPTPQISSDVQQAPSESSQSDTELQPRRTRASTLDRTHPRILTIDSSPTSQGDSSSEPEREERRLRKERKRIRGVLPASWLKIDLKAQKRKTPSSPIKMRKLCSLSPLRIERPQKGIAQRISKTSRTPQRDNAISISNDEYEFGEMRSQSPPYLLQGHQYVNRDGLTVLSDVFEDEQMECDWVDPMLSGPSRGTRRDISHPTRQIQIKDKFQEANGPLAFSPKEKAGLQHRFARSSWSKPRHNRSARSHRPPALSILDAPGLPSANCSLPQFIRLAQRQARAQPENGRHSPSRKIIRLATKGDTDDAQDLLESWRKGRIAPRPQYRMASGRSVKSASADLESEGELEEGRGWRSFQHSLQQSARNLFPSRLRQSSDLSLGENHMTAVRPYRRQHHVDNVAHGHPKNVTTISSAAALPSIPSNKWPSMQRGKKTYRLDPRGFRLRRAQLESLENTFDQEHRDIAFERRMNILTETVARAARPSRSRVLPLERYLDDHSEKSVISSPCSQYAREFPVNQSVDLAPSQLHLDGNSATMAPRQRKRVTHHVDSDARWYRQPSEPLSDLESADNKKVEATYLDESDQILQGLKPFGSRYAIDFDIRPLPVGTFFHESTFIGSGDFLAALTCTQRDLSIVVGSIRVHVDGEILQWGAWTEEVAAGIERIPHAVFEEMKTLGSADMNALSNEQLSVVLSNIDHMLRSVVKYCSKCLAFLDSMDRRRCIQTLLRYVDDLSERLKTANSSDQAIHAIQMRCWQYTLVVATQTHLLSLDSSVTTDLVEKCQAQRETIAALLSKELLPTGLIELRNIYEENHHRSKRESGIRSEGSTITNLVILQHCLQIQLRDDPFWTGINETLMLASDQLNTVSRLDLYWYNILSVLPALEVDSSGFACLGSRLRNTKQNWPAVKHLVDRVFQLYPATSAVRGTTINEYVRAILARCFLLVTKWGWWKCEAVLSTIFDFFAKRNLEPLCNEESHGSPRFLSELEHQPSLELQPQDRSFHIFLKLLASSLLGMQKYGIYSDRKIGSIAWRFIPNHGRTYRKDSDVKQGDIDALRNHHDLLCTLYFASPPSHRIRLELLRNLVDHSTSHREACRLSVRAWANIASFHASTTEPPEKLQPFTEWYQEILRTTVTQYKLAKTEAETDYAVAKAQGAVDITDAMLASTIANNQQQIAATLVDALISLKRSLQAASSLSIAYALVDRCAFWRPFVPFDAGERRLYSALEESLEIVKTALEVQGRFRCHNDGQESGEESQDYGDLDALQEIAANQPSSGTTTPNVVRLLNEPISQLVSSIFGADEIIDDHLLSKIIDVWIRLAKESVRTTVRSWSSYFDEYSPWSWRQLRDTEQRRRYTALFLARLIEEAAGIPADLRSEILSAWFILLIEREALLKYQHVLTEAVLNRIGSDPLLKNVPFVKNPRTRLYSINMQELRQRRLALISTVLSNMRQHFDETRRQNMRYLQEWRSTYGGMLRSLMQAMKKNYQELQTSTDPNVADSNTQSSYVDFVQHVVSFLQQHTTDICRVDTFFTDSSAFPLPVNDPTYVVGKLKSYVPRLAESKARKQLAFFIHTVSERAAVDNQQQYLVEQLCSAMDNVIEQGETASPSLQHVMLTSILPVYIEAALTTACSWILALPILEACAIVGAGLLYTLKLEDRESVKATVEKIEAILHAIQQPLLLAATNPGLLRLPRVQSILSRDFRVGTSLLTSCAYLHKVAGKSEGTIAGLKTIHFLALKIQAQINGAEETSFIEFSLPRLPAAPSPWTDTKLCTQKQLKESLEKDWHTFDGQYFLRKCNTSKEVIVHLSDDEDDDHGFISALVEFVESFDMIVGRPCNRPNKATWSYGMENVLV